MTQSSIWLIGAAPDISSLTAGSLAGQSGLRVFDGLDDAQAQLARSLDAPELVVLAQVRPGEFVESQIEALRSAAPLARVWRVVGSWCEGEGRSAPPPGGCSSVYWHQWPARWGRELARRQRGELASWSLPLTASPEERTLALSAEPLARAAGPLAIFSRHPQAAAALADACRLGGYDVTIIDVSCPTPLLMSGSSPPPIILWDALPEQIADARAIGEVRAICGAGPIVAVVGFARTDDCQRSVAAGVAAVVTKPYLIHDLLWQLAEVRDPGGERTAAV
jgi:CheY-like chemotaxis protein